ncbi:MAG: LytTR family transcriptional regulator [Bacteroidaceae bacterium]|nr:LytTR family transcriptional regulator [Bacteroidaceae bacterium]
MNKRLQQILKVRVASTFFIVLALAVFKPFGLEVWQWKAYVHLLNIFVIGVFVCLLSDVVMKYIVRMPMSNEKGVDYIIRRNLYFQLINTPLVALAICIYRHFVLNSRVEGNQLSWSNYFETLVIIAFCCFAIGLYWRFKYRSKFLAMELEETKLLNEQLQTNTLKQDTIEAQPSSTIVLRGTTSDSITLQVSDLLYVEAVGNYVKVYHLLDGKVRNDMLRATSKQMEDDLRDYPMIVRCHRAFLVNLQQVEQIISKSGAVQLLIKHCHEYLPVSRNNVLQVKETIKKL